MHLYIICYKKKTPNILYTISPLAVSLSKTRFQANFSSHLQDASYFHNVKSIAYQKAEPELHQHLPTTTKIMTLQQNIVQGVTNFALSRTHTYRGNHQMRRHSEPRSPELPLPNGTRDPAPSENQVQLHALKPNWVRGKTPNPAILQCPIIVPMQHAIFLREPFSQYVYEQHEISAANLQTVINVRGYRFSSIILEDKKKRSRVFKNRIERTMTV